MSDKRAVVRLDSIAGYAAPIPHLLGFAPTESLVVTALRGTEVIVSARVDLPTAPSDYGDCAHAILCRFVHAEVDELMVAIVTETPGRRVFAGLVDAVAAGALPARDAVFIRDGRVWSYLCENAQCCPPDRLPLGDSVDLAAASILAGLKPFADRDAVIATVERSPDAILVESALAHSPIAALPDLRRFTDPRATLSIDEGAAAVLALTNPRIRDEFIQQLSRDEDAI